MGAWSTRLRRWRQALGLLAHPQLRQFPPHGTHWGRGQQPARRSGRCRPWRLQRAPRAQRQARLRAQGAGREIEVVRKKGGVADQSRAAAPRPRGAAAQQQRGQSPAPAPARPSAFIAPAKRSTFAKPKNGAPDDSPPSPEQAPVAATRGRRRERRPGLRGPTGAALAARAARSSGCTGSGAPLDIGAHAIAAGGVCGLRAGWSSAGHQLGIRRF
jgi:hypothetical protein